jgi:FkbM family methyltransferase
MLSLSIRLRSLARRIGLNRLVYRAFRAITPNTGYEESFHRALEDTVKPGDTVWDVGANVGIYTELFCKWVGPQGQVVAFEPNPKPIAKIRDRLTAFPWLTVENVALGSREEGSTLIVEGEYTVSGHIHYEGENDAARKLSIPIQLTTGDKVCARIGRYPNVVKVDVEGFEEEVLLGLDRTLLCPELRAVLIEVHFRELELRGQADAPTRIRSLLRNKGFRINWIDANHLIAKRA